MVLAGCSSGFSRADAVESYRAATPEASIEESACVIDALIERYETEPVDEDALDGLEAELSLVPRRDEFLLDQFRAEFGCGMTDDVEAQLRRELRANDLDADAVDCVAAELSSTLDDDGLDVLINDEMTDSFYTTFFTAVEACDALPS